MAEGREQMKKANEYSEEDLAPVAAALGRGSRKAAKLARTLWPNGMFTTETNDEAISTAIGLLMLSAKVAVMAEMPHGALMSFANLVSSVARSDNGELIPLKLVVFGAQPEKVQ